MPDSSPAGMSGYLHADYAASFDDVATVRYLPLSGGWILERAIPGSAYVDGTGCYPLFSCADWTRLGDDLAALTGLVSLTLVTDPFGRFETEDLTRCFDRVTPYKDHYVADLRRAGDLPATRRHRRNTARARQLVQIELVIEPWRMADPWVSLYGQLVERRRIAGLRAFTPRGLQRQLTVPGLRMFVATCDGDIVGVHLWYVQGDVAYGHLGATSARGYEVMASYALYDVALAHLRREVQWLELGSSAGSPDEEGGVGLRRFKAGWATGTRPTYLCGRVFQRDVYETLALERGVAGSPYFPAYRHWEFAASPTGRNDVPIPTS